MAKTNQIIENAIIGDRVRFLVTSKDSNGALLRVELWCRPGAKGTPLHYHPIQRESFTVLKGQLGIYDQGKEMILQAGQSHTVAPDSLHRFWNASPDEEVLVTVDLMPALKTEFFFETLYSLSNQGKTNKDSLPKDPLQFAALLNEYYGELFAAGPPLALQKFMARVVGGFARLLGYKGFIPYQKPGPLD